MPDMLILFDSTKGRIRKCKLKKLFKMQAEETKSLINTTNEFLFFSILRKTF